MKKSNKAMSIKAHLWLYFCIFAVAIMAVLWILQILFMGTFFNSMKLKEMEKVGNVIAKQYDLNNENFHEFWFKHSFESGIFAQLISENGEIVQNFNPIRTEDKLPERANSGTHDGHPPRPGFASRGFISQENVQDFIDEISSKEGDVSYIRHSKKGDPDFAVYGTYLGKLDGEKVYLYLVSPLERTETTRKVLETQLIIISFILILLALVIAYFIAKRISKPIERTTESAKELAKGEYGTKFDKGTYSEINELSNVLNQTSIELQKTEELRRDLISNVSHDLRTPLTIIKSYAEMIRDISGTNAEKRDKHTGVIIEETNKLSSLVNDMLDLSRIQSGTMPMEIKPFQLDRAVRSTVARFEYYIETKGFNFVQEYDCKDNVYGDERRIEQVIYNLIANAVNYTGDDKCVTVSVKDMGDAVRFSIKDTGRGIKEEDLDHVWDKYYKASETHKREKIGTGIGLSIVKNILMLHKAKFGVLSKVGAGSEFWFELKKLNE